MATGLSRIRRHVWIRGFVQGVNFRNAAREVAEQLQIAGWIQNLADGRVEAVFEGPRDSVDRMVNWCKHGPPASRVDELEVLPEPAGGEFLRFRVVR